MSWYGNDMKDGVAVYRESHPETEADKARAAEALARFNKEKAERDAYWKDRQDEAQAANQALWDAYNEGRNQ